MWQRIAPVLTLLLLAPIISEVLSGSTRISTMFVLIPEIGIWGGGALIIRYLARRWQRDWITIFLLGLVLALAEECLIQQTSLAPLVGVDPAHVYARVWGVNWLYLLWALGYESIWVVVAPIQLTELIFPEQRTEVWIGRRGLIVTSLFFLIASFMAWYSWTQIFVPRYFPQGAYQVPLPAFGIALAAMIVLTVMALIRKPAAQSEKRTASQAPQPWLVGLVTCMLGLVWFLQILLAYGAIPSLPVPVSIGAGLILAVAAFFLLRSWSSGLGWGDAQRFALVVGIIIATLLGGLIILNMNTVLTMSHASLMDSIGQVVFNVITLLLLIPLARRIQRSQARIS
jgi:hypothetical protein